MSQCVNVLKLLLYQVNSAWNLDRSKSQWVDLGIHTEACMTHPEACGAAGGAISLWLKIVESERWSRIVSSDASNRQTALVVYCGVNDTVYVKIDISS